MTRPGEVGEDAATDFLRSHGYRILERNYRCKCGEIDIIAEQDGTLCFIEVKSRSSLAYGFPAEAVNRTKQKHITRVATHYLQTNFPSVCPPCRFDVVVILPPRQPELISNAFNADRHHSGW